MSRPPSRSPQRPAQSGGGSGGARRPSQSANSNDDSKASTVHLLFDRPSEPVFLPKGEGNAVFDIPNDFIVEEFRPARDGLINRIKGSAAENIPVRRITPPNINDVIKLGRRDNFSLFFPYHRELAGKLIDIFMGMKNFDDFVAASVYCRDRVNSHLFIYALSVAILHRPDTKNIPLSPLYEQFPDKFMEGGVFKKAREMANVLEPNERTPIEIPQDYTASDVEAEHKVAYFREDMGINLHHWHWHLVYPFAADIRIVNKDRRGELFYYMHQQIISRYNFERLCNNMPRVERMASFRDPLPEGYFPKLDNIVSSRSWTPRPANALLSDVNREIDQLRFDLSDLERWRDRLLDAIAQKAIIDENGRRVPLDEVTGVDILGNLMEASILSRNRTYYGDFHNFGHVAIGLCHDPDGRHLETFSVMADPGTTMRDPAFYRWHAYIDYIFQQHKNLLPAYTTSVLDYPGVRFSGLEVVTKGRNKNEFSTFWEQNDVNLSRGMDFLPRGNVFARFTHLQNQDFSYRIQVENTTGQPKTGTVRIFLAPKFDEKGAEVNFNDVRLQFIELDRFVVTFKNRQTTIERKSTESSLTIPFESTFRNLERGRPAGGQQLDEFNFCGCGWPQHMLIPKGSPDGFPCILFAMVSNIDGDRVEQSNTGGQRRCDDASMFCGIRDQKYPDRRSMGFPFERVARENVDTLASFLTPNMITTDVRIVFSSKIQPGRSRQKN